MSRQSLGVKRRSATPATSSRPVRVRCDLVWRRHCGVLRLAGLAAAALIAATVSGCGSGDSTVAKTPQATATGPTSVPRAPGPHAANPTPTPSAAADPCAVNLGAPAIARAVSELPRDPRSQQPWNPEP